MAIRKSGWFVRYSYDLVCCLAKCYTFRGRPFDAVPLVSQKDINRYELTLPNPGSEGRFHFVGAHSSRWVRISRAPYVSSGIRALTSAWGTHMTTYSCMSAILEPLTMIRKKKKKKSYRSCRLQLQQVLPVQSLQTPNLCSFPPSESLSIHRKYRHLYLKSERQRGRYRGPVSPF